jgi:hypothetical protein
MSSRREEKERRRQERLERERREAAAATRRRRLQYAFGALLAVGVLVGVAVLGIAALGGGGDEEVAASSGSSEQSEPLPELPEQEERDVKAAAEAAGCELVHPSYEGNDHADRTFTADDYETNPPTSGTHTPDWYDDGIYEPGGVTELGKLVHSLEHGRINVQYRQGAPEQVVRNLRAFFAEQDSGYHMLLYENTTDMDYEVAATAWTQLLGCPEYNNRVPDALRTFRERYIDQGPERVP